MRVRAILASALALAIVVSGGLARAGVPIQTVVTFNPAAGEFPEGLAIDKTGDIYVSLVGPVDEIRTFSPDGTQSTLAHFAVPGFGPLGIAIDASGAVYVAVASFEAATQGVYRVRPDGTSQRLTGTGGIQFPNGLAFDHLGNLYATDSILGAVWRIQRGGSAEIWFQSPLLEGNGAAGLGFPLGANGIAFRNNEIIVSNTEGARLVNIPVQPDGSAGSPTVMAEGAALFGADGIALDVHGDVFVAVNPQSMLLRVENDGSITSLAAAADGLNNPASLAFGTGMGNRKSLFVTNFAVFSSAPTPALLKVAVGEPGLPLP